MTKGQMLTTGSIAAMSLMLSGCFFDDENSLRDLVNRVRDVVPRTS